MLSIERTNRFKKDYKLMQKRGKNLDKIKQVIIQLANGHSLERKYKDHQLTGNYKYARECHIEPDWLLIYVITADFLRLERTGSHADLFGM